MAPIKKNRKSRVSKMIMLCCRRGKLEMCVIYAKLSDQIHKKNCFFFEISFFFQLSPEKMKIFEILRRYFIISKLRILSVKILPTPYPLLFSSFSYLHTNLWHNVFFVLNFGFRILKKLKYSGYPKLQSQNFV